MDLKKYTTNELFAMGDLARWLQAPSKENPKWTPPWAMAVHDLERIIDDEIAARVREEERSCEA